MLFIRSGGKNFLIVFLIMSNALIQHMRDQVNNLTHERNNFRRELRNEVAQNRNLNRVGNNLRRRCDTLERQNQILTDVNKHLRDKLKPINPKKQWSRIGQQTKRKRKADYFEIFNDALKRIAECKKG